MDKYFLPASLFVIGAVMATMIGSWSVLTVFTMGAALWGAYVWNLYRSK